MDNNRIIIIMPRKKYWISTVNYSSLFKVVKSKYNASKRKGHFTKESINLWKLTAKEICNSENAIVCPEFVFRLVSDVQYANRAVCIFLYLVSSHIQCPAVSVQCPV